MHIIMSIAWKYWALSLDPWGFSKHGASINKGALKDWLRPFLKPELHKRRPSTFNYQAHLVCRLPIVFTYGSRIRAYR